VQRPMLPWDGEKVLRSRSFEVSVVVRGVLTPRLGIWSVPTTLGLRVLAKYFVLNFTDPTLPRTNGSTVSEQHGENERYTHPNTDKRGIRTTHHMGEAKRQTCENSEIF